MDVTAMAGGRFDVRILPLRFPLMQMNIRKSEVFRQQKEIDDRDRQHRGLNHRLELMMEWDVQSNLRKKEIHKAKVAVTQRREREKEEAAKKAVEKVRTACHEGPLLALALLVPPCRQLLTGIHA